MAHVVRTTVTLLGAAVLTLLAAYTVTAVHIHSRSPFVGVPDAG